MYYAHSKSDAPKSEWQTLKEHSQNVAKRVCDFSKAWCAEDYAWNLGLLHDIGKYQKSFQDMLDGKKINLYTEEGEEYGITFDISIEGDTLMLGKVEYTRYVEPSAEGSVEDEANGGTAE